MKCSTWIWWDVLYCFVTFCLPKIVLWHIKWLQSDDLRIKGRELVNPKFEMIKERAIPLRTWVCKIIISVPVYILNLLNFHVYLLDLKAFKLLISGGRHVKKMAFWEGTRRKKQSSTKGALKTNGRKILKLISPD